jgi:large subunit ribosomal protein L6
MSRVGKHEVKVPSSVSFSRDGTLLKFNGKLGEDTFLVPECISVELTDAGLKVTPKDDSKFAFAMWGTVQRSLTNIVKGVSDGFTVGLELVGVGYRASVTNSKLVLQLGYSHDIEYVIPAGVTIKCEKPTSVSVTASSKQKAGAIAALIRSYRPPEPYKGKGVIRVGEFVVRKEGKKK